MDAPRAFDHEQDLSTLHQGLIDQLKSRGHIVTPTVEAAFRAVPRHLFLPDVPPEEAYRDQVIATKSLEGRVVSSSSQPAIMAIMLEQLQLQPGQSVLEIGAGTGYNAALMAHIVGENGQVVTIDIDKDIVEKAQKQLAGAGYARVQVLCHDGFAGYADAAPYDRIILTVNASDIAPAWREQLKSDGRLLLPLTLRGPQAAVAFEQAEDHLEHVSLTPCGFMGLRGILTEPECHLLLRPEPHRLHLSFNERRTVDKERIQHWLSGNPGQTFVTSLEITPDELRHGLHFWLALHEPLFCILRAQDLLNESYVASMPFQFPSAHKGLLSSTAGILSEQGLCLITRPPDPDVSGTDEVSQHTPFRVSLSSFGTDETLVQRFAEQMLAWDALGRPDEQSLRIRAYPQELPYHGTEKDLVVEKRWTRFVFNWVR